MKCFGKMRNEGYTPDAIHAHIFSAGPPAVILGKRYNIPVIITEHMSAFPQRTLSIFKKMMARYAMNRAKIILPVSENLKKHIQHYRINNNFCVVPNTVNTEIFYPSLEPDRGNDDPIKILTVALLAPIKGIPYLLEALHGMRDNRQRFTLDIIGDGPMRTEYEKIAASFKLNKSVTFHGIKSKQEVADFMRSCDFLVLPSHRETFGVVLAEAMACGKPVIATNVGAVNEIVSKNVGLLIPPSDLDTLRKGIEFMINNYRNYNADKIAAYAREKFGYDSVGYMLDRIYKEHS
jgi:glycosyltransferase involved in cell wall biosynthesis